MAARSKNKKNQTKTKSLVAIPSTPKATFPIVGIGASAGGLEAFEKFFTHMPPDSGMAFVLVQHLDPTHASILTDLLQKYTRMSVTQVENKMQVEPNKVFVIPPNQDMAFSGNRLHLSPPAMPRGLRLPIDYFFRSLAADQQERAICIVLSGTGTDGTLGLKAIKEAGGLTLVQTPESARYDGMPVSAINTGLVDVVLSPEKLAEQLVDYVQRAFKGGSQYHKPLLPGINDCLQKIFTLLRENTGHDFSGYKENTISRRIERRMAVNQITQVEDYLSYLQRTPVEIETLFQELLIGVTAFFRDKDAFEGLTHIVIMPHFLQANNQKRQIRVWVPGCSTGEEAYSIAMLLEEHRTRTHQNLHIQVFATDIDQIAIEKAREGLYPDSIAADVSQNRLQRFFVKKDDSNVYQIKQQIRDMVVFAVQSVIKDPPFSKLDLICCRNLLIYLGPELQQKLLPLFHYALNPGGFLFLGNSETLGSSQRLFHTLDQKWKIFQRGEINSDIKSVLEFPTPSTGRREFRPPALQLERQFGIKNLKGAVEELLLTGYTPACLVVNEKGDMLYVHGRTGKYLEHTTGETSVNALQMAREGLRMPLSTALRKVKTHKKPHVIDGVSVRTNGHMTRIKLCVDPITQPASLQGLMLVTIYDIAPPTPLSDEAGKGAHGEDEHHQRILELEQELKSTREYLQTTIEELETTNEELKSANEELQSSNEELQSTNEELQTSKEELQSVNEELVTVNSELHNKVDELTGANNDIKNLLDNTQIGIIFLDMDLRVRRFTAAAKQIVELIAADVGRPIAQFVNKLHYEDLIKDARKVRDSLSSKELEVMNEDGRWYLMRIMPYRTTDNHIDGVVLTFADISQLKEGEARYRRLVEGSPDIVYSYSNNKGGDYYSAKVSDILGYSQDYLNAHPFLWHDAIHPEDLPRIEQAIHDNTMIQGTSLEYRIKDAKGNWLWFEDRIIGKFIKGDEIRIEGLATDISARKLAAQALQKERDTVQLYFDFAGVILVVLNTECRVRNINRRGCEILGYAREEVIGKHWFETFLPENVRQEVYDMLEPLMHSDGKQFQYAENPVLTQSGEERLIAWHNTVLRNEQGAAIGSLSSGEDITERKRMERALRDSEIQFRALAEASPDMISRFDHELKYVYVNPKLLEATGLPLAHFIGNTLSDSGLSSATLANYEQQMRSVFATGEPANIEYEYSTPSGIRHFQSLIVPEAEKNDAIQRIIAITRDVTDYVEAKRSAENSLANLEAMLENTNHLICARDREHRLTYYNSAFSKMGEKLFHQPTVIGMNTLECLPEAAQQHWQPILQRVLGGNAFRKNSNGASTTAKNVIFICPIIPSAKVMRLLAIPNSPRTSPNASNMKQKWPCGWTCLPMPVGGWCSASRAPVASSISIRFLPASVVIPWMN